MCCLFGMVDCQGWFSAKEKAHILSVLAAECEERGTDATGIAYYSKDRLRIYKRPLAAHKMRFRIPMDSHVIMGHTRMTTQGRASRNRNNHPFLGHADGKAFALAHNGVLYNDKSLRSTCHLPKTNIETDSYIAVQLIEQKKTLDFASLRYMAEQVEGSFTFTLLDEQENLYFVKGSNPMCLYYYPQAGVYLYASTETILQRALHKLRLPIGKYETVELVCGDILKITPSGQREPAVFDASELLTPLYDPSNWYRPAKRPYAADDDYVQELKSVACCFGYTPETIDELLAGGFAPEEIEEFLYEGDALCEW